MKVAIVSGLCVGHDAVSSIVASELRVLREAGHEAMVFAQAVDRLRPDEFRVVHSPWTMVHDPFFEAAELIIFHFGIRYDLFDALLFEPSGARRVVRFHNVTPPILLEGEEHWAAIRSMDQISIAEHADAAWCDSPNNRDVLLEHSDLSPDRVTVVPIHVPMVDREPGERVGHQGVRIQAVGRLVPAKGLMDLVEAYALVDPEHRRHTQLELVGSLTHSDLAFIGRMMDRVHALGLDGQVTMRHDLSDEQLHQSYVDADIVVSASHHEGFCLPVVEALASGCEVVVTDAGAQPDTVGEHGAIVPVADPVRLAGAISQAITVVRTDAWRTGQADRLRARAVHLVPFSKESTRQRFLEEVGRLRNMDRQYSVTVSNRDGAVFIERHRRLLGALACPHCRSPLTALRSVEACGSVVHADMMCPDHGRCGVVDSFKAGFLERDLTRHRRAHDVVSEVLDLLRELRTDGHWNSLREGLFASRETSSVTFDAGSAGFELRCLGGPWSGGLKICRPGVPPVVVDLFCAESEEVVYECEESFTAEREVTLKLVASPSNRSSGVQAIIGRVTRFVSPQEARVPELGPCNRGNPYPARFGELVAGLGPEALVLDCGGGDRRFGDPRVLNLEYLEYSLPDVYGDGLDLAFADDSFDLVLSQAVLEHVPDPQRVVDELERVLKPGGLLWVEAALKQPLHAVPHHFMNISPQGITHLCRNLEILEDGSFGGLAGTIEWIGGLVDASARLGADRFSAVLDVPGELHAGLSDAEGRQFASAVYVLGRKVSRSC